MDIICAKKAREMSEKGIKSDMKITMETIIESAKKGETYCDITTYLKPKTVDFLRELGYVLEPYSSFATQRESLYYRIKW